MIARKCPYCGSTQLKTLSDPNSQLCLFFCACGKRVDKSETKEVYVKDEISK